MACILDLQKEDDEDAAAVAIAARISPDEQELPKAPEKHSEGKRKVEECSKKANLAIQESQ